MAAPTGRMAGSRYGPDERYLAAATDLADLERRMRVLERANRGPFFVTFNHWRSGHARIAVSAIASRRLRRVPTRAWSDIPWNTAL